LAGGLAVLAVLASVYMTRQADPDLWGHLRYGQLFVEERRLPESDPFAFTTAGQHWSSHEYLAQVLLWLAYAAGGQAGLVLLKCLVAGAAVYCLWRTLRLVAPDWRIAVPVLLMASHLLARWFLFRPQLFTFFFFALFVHVLFLHLLGRRSRLWLLPLVMPLWVNLHGGFLAGIGAIGLVLLLRLAQAWPGASIRQLCRAVLPLFLALIGCIAATLLNPLGWRLWPYLATELTCEVNRRFIEEWQPLSLADHGWMAWTFYFFIGVLVMAFAAAGRRRIHGVPAWAWLLSCVPLTFLATRSIRHVPICVLWTAPVLALLAEASLAWRPRGVWRGLWLGVSGLTAMVAIMMVRCVLADPAPAINLNGPVLGTCSPRGAVAFLSANHLRGRIYNPLWWGSYLTWELHPDILVSMDGRNVTMFPAPMVAENLEFFLTDDAAIDAPLQQGADFLLVPTDAPVLRRARHDDRWAVLFEDSESTLFVRADEAHAALLHQRDAAQLTVPPPAALALERPPSEPQ
jgi:hypothetical protein